jgi:prepilin-type N-terminal cleavage/methylation domain-containing protein
MRVSEKHSREAGFTVVELSVVMVIMGVVATALVGMLVSQSRLAERVNSAANNQEVLRQALIEVSKDVRASDPILWQSDITAYGSTLPMRIRSVSNDVDRNLRWRISQGALIREELDATASNVTAVSYRIPNISNSTVFTYYRADGSAYALSGLDAGALDRCTVKVHIKITGSPEAGPAATTVETDVQVRNRLPLPNEVWCTS